MTPSRDLLLDVSRPIWRAWTGGRATGVDRVCLAYLAQYRGRAQAVVQWRGRLRILPRAVSDDLFDALSAPREHFRGSLLRSVLRRAPALAYDRAGGGRLYLNIGHTGLDHPRFVDAVDRADVRPVYLLHDLIPITHPHFARAGEPERHERRISAMVRTGAGIIVNSGTTRDSLTRWAMPKAVALPSICVAWLGTQRLADHRGPSPLAQPYFVMLGTIEGRKNHRLLLDVWRGLIARGGHVPKLVVIGKRGWAAEETFALLDEDITLQGHVVELSDCDDETLAAYLAHARALLFPSFAEGYGMPLAEALAVGVPTIVSDIPAFREIGQGLPSYLSAADPAAWSAAVTSAAAAPSPSAAQRAAAAARFVSPRWSDHFERVDRFLATL